MLAAAAVRNMNEHYAFAVGFIVNNQDESRSTGTREQTERRDNKKKNQNNEHMCQENLNIIL